MDTKKTENIKINFLTKFDTNIGSARIRIFNIVPYLKKYFQSVTINEDCSNTDIIVLQKILDIQLLNKLRKLNKFICFDTDDLLPNMNDMIIYADLVIVSTEYLKSILINLNPNIIVVPNSLDISDINIAPKIYERTHKLVWFGNHQNSYILDRYGIRNMVKTISNGGDIEYNKDTIDSELQKFDICLIPQERNKHTLAKTHCRFIKALYLGLPCFISDMPEYMSFAEQINYPSELIIQDPKDWSTIIKELKSGQYKIPPLNFSQIREKIRQLYGPEIVARQMAVKLTDNFLENNKKKVKTQKTKQLSHKLFVLACRKLLQNIFSVKNQKINSKKQKVITIFGIKKYI